MAQAMVNFAGDKAKANLNEALTVGKLWNNFYMAKYAAFEVTMHLPSGYINVSPICKEHGKQIKHWNSLKNSKQMIADMAEAITLRGDDAVTEHDMVIIIKGGSAGSH